MKTTLVPLSKIKPYIRNARKHPEKQITLLASLMKKYGVDQPIVVDEKFVILKGHGRRLAALQAGFKDYPVVMQRGLKAEDKQAIRIADNQVALLAGWDDDLLKIEIKELKSLGFDLAMIGFSEAKFDVLFDSNSSTQAQLDGLKFSVIVECDSEKQQADLLTQFEKKGLKCRALIS